MSDPSREYELILLGATGYTGAITAEWISTHLPTDLKWAIAGRNAKKLQAVADELKQLNPNRQPPGRPTSRHIPNNLLTTPKPSKHASLRKINWSNL
jgi:hypothetical protein